STGSIGKAVGVYSVRVGHASGSKQNQQVWSVRDGDDQVLQQWIAEITVRRGVNERILKFGQSTEGHYIVVSPGTNLVWADTAGPSPVHPCCVEYQSGDGQQYFCTIAGPKSRKSFHLKQLPSARTMPLK